MLHGTFGTSTEAWKHANGDYKRYVHLVAFVEEPTYATAGIRICTHWAYPWPSAMEPTFRNIVSVYHLSKFDYWPLVWKSFMTEFQLSTTPSELNKRSAPLSMYHGPYLIPHPCGSKNAVANEIVETKHNARLAIQKALIRKYKHDDPAACVGRDSVNKQVGDYVADAVLKKYEPFRVHNYEEIEQCA